MSQGTLTITFFGKQRTDADAAAVAAPAVGGVPRPRLALRLGCAQASWLDDRGQGIEVSELIESTTHQVAGVALKIARG